MPGARLASPLHAARAGVAATWCVALAAVALSTDHPPLLGAVGLTVAGAAVLARVARPVGRAVLFALPLAILFSLVNPLVSRNGLTVVLRLGELPPFGQLDLTLEALVYGLVFGLRVVVVIGAFALLTAAVDPDELLGLFRRVAPRSALTAVLATRMVPVLARDAARLDEARRCRADAGGSGPVARLAVLRTVVNGSMDRALDVAATLEVRGYGTGGPGRPASRAPWSRHDRGFTASAVALALLAGVVIAGAACRFAPYPTLHLELGVPEAVLLVALPLIALLPFADRRGVQR